MPENDCNILLQIGLLRPLVVFVGGITRFIFKQPTTPREGLGIVLVVVGVAVLVWAY